MRATTTRAWDALRAGRPARAVAAQIVTAYAVAAVLWACGCAFMLMEPSEAGAVKGRQSVAGGFQAREVPEVRHGTSYPFLRPLIGRFGAGDAVASRKADRRG